MTGGTRVAVLGGGAIGQIVVNALVTSGFTHSHDVVATTRTTASANRLRARQPSWLVLDVESRSTANSDAVCDANLVVIAVKPYVVPEVLREISQAVESHALVVCVAAGIRLARLATALPQTTRVARVLPNTPTRVGRGVIGICVDRRVGLEDERVLRKAFEPLGLALSVDEGGIDLISAVGGSGPAYFYYFAEALAAAAVRRGMDADVAAAVVRETLVGSAALLESAQATTFSSLRAEVTSPRGTTERAVARLESDGLADLVEAAVDAALARTYELDTDAEWM